jgi:SHS2 domain-containing protein
MQKGYRLLEHTADMGLEARALSRARVHEEMARGLAMLVFGDCAVKAKIKTKLFVRAEDPVELLVCWLNEVVYWSEKENLVPSGFHIESVSDKELQATITGEPYDVERHNIEHQIKSVTYHQACLEETADGWYSRVYIDL